MKVKELKEKLDNLPDDMEVLMVEEVAGVLPLTNLEIEELNLVQHHEWNSKSFEYKVWEYPINPPFKLYKAEIVKVEKCLVLNYY